MVVADGPFWVIDVEGNGAAPPEIVEIALLEVSDLRITGRQFHWLVRPNEPIQPSVTRIHGLTDADVAHAPSIDDIAEDILRWTDGAAIIGHNVRVELDVVGRSIPDWRPRAAIDTLKLARILKPGLESYGLEKLGRALGHADLAAQRSGRQHHSAIYDVTLTALVFVDLVSGVEKAKRSGVLSDADILDNRQGALL